MNEDGVSRLTEYIIVTGVLLVLMIVMMFTVNSVFMQGPADKLRYHAFVDIGNGISTRIVDLYVISPANGTIETKFDIPDDVAGADYFVEASGNVQSQVAIAGIGATRAVTGNTTGAGWNRIQYNSSGFE